MNWIRLVAVFLGCMWGAHLSAQWWKGISLEGTFHIGKIVKHTPKLTYTPPPLTTGFDLNIGIQTYGQKAWHQLQDYPLFGVSLVYFDLGDSDQLGRAVGINPNLTIYLRKRPKYDLRFQVGTGVAWINRFYDRIDNPLNNAIGSRLNNITHFKFISTFRLNNHWSLQAGASFTHFSNGAAQLPNFGINIPALTFGIHYRPRPLQAEDFLQHDITKARLKRWGFGMHLGLAYKEIQAFGGPRFPIRIAMIEGLYHLSRINRIHFGFEYEFNRAVYFFGRSVFAFNSEREARWRSSRLMFFVGDEFLFGNIGINLQAGAYLGDFFLNVYPIYNKLTTRYYFPAFGRPKGRMYLSVTLKSHLSIAEYIGFGGGVVF